MHNPILKKMCIRIVEGINKDAKDEFLAKGITRETIINSFYKTKEGYTKYIGPINLTLSSPAYVHESGIHPQVFVYKEPWDLVSPACGNGDNCPNHPDYLERIDRLTKKPTRLRLDDLGNTWFIVEIHHV